MKGHSQQVQYLSPRVPTLRCSGFSKVADINGNVDATRENLKSTAADLQNRSAPHSFYPCLMNPRT